MRVRLSYNIMGRSGRRHDHKFGAPSVSYLCELSHSFSYAFMNDQINQSSFLIFIVFQEKAKLTQRSVLVEEEVETRTQAVYDSRLREELQAMREQSQEELENYKLSMEETFRTKLSELRSLSDRSSADAVHSREELMTLRKRMDSISAELASKVRNRKKPK